MTYNGLNCCGEMYLVHDVNMATLRQNRLLFVFTILYTSLTDVHILSFVENLAINMSGKLPERRGILDLCCHDIAHHHSTDPEMTCY